MQTMSQQDLQAMVGSVLVDPGGERIGKITDVLVDEATKRPEWVAVATGLFGLKDSFVPMAGVHRSDAPGDEFVSRFSKALVKDAPTSEGALSPTEEDELYRHYGMNRPTAG
jgi:hypothetical protein